MFLFFIFTLEMKYNFFFTKFFLSITLESLFTLILHFTSILENCIFPVIVYIQSGHWIQQSEFEPRRHFENWSADNHVNNKLRSVDV